MKNFYRHWFTLLLVFCAFSGTYAQADTTKPVKIAVFVPLYLDDAFDGYTYQLGNEALPKNLLPGLEFYNGVMMAVDSLSKEGAKLEINIYDSKQPAADLTRLFNGYDLNNTGLIIASLTSAQEVKVFADEAMKKNIPLISATYPSVGSVNSNPFFVLLNSSLRTHLEGIYKHLQSYYATNNIVVFKRAGTVENYIKTTFTQLNTTTRSVPLKWKWVDLPESFTQNDILKNLDSTRLNVVLVASPLESFGVNVVKTISGFEQYRTTAVGMPTWDGIKELNRDDCRNVEIVYSTPFNYSRSDRFESLVIKKYKTKYYSRPSDMVFRGFETTYHFGKLLLQYRSNLINNLSSSNYKLFNDFSVAPVKLRSSSVLPDYLENKKLYFIKKQDGNLKSVL
jgi:hypothetical protein